jgi:hypothetical protein
MAGYSGTPLPKKLGIEAGHKVCLLNAPRSFERKVYEADDVRVAHDLRMPPVDIVVLFVDCIADLERRVTDIAMRLHPAGGLWVAWSKRGGTDITEEVVRRIALAAGMIDNKACSIGNGYAGVRLVLRGENRDAVAYRAAPPPLSRRTRRTTAVARMAHRFRQASGAGSTLRRARARSTK